MKVNFSVCAGRITLAGTVTSLGTLDEAAGTIEYDGGTQDVTADAYYNLEIDQSGVKSQASGTMTVAGTMTVQSAATYALDTRDITVTGTTTSPVAPWAPSPPPHPPPAP